MTAISSFRFSVQMDKASGLSLTELLTRGMGLLSKN